MVAVEVAKQQSDEPMNRERKKQPKRGELSEFVPVVPGSPYSRQVGDQILNGIASGKSLNEVCKAKGMPDPRSVFNWVQANPEFATRYDLAKEERAHLLADQILAIADAPARTSEEVQRNRLRVDARKWLASKLLPRVYADRIEANGVFALVDLAAALEAARRRVIDG